VNFNLYEKINYKVTDVPKYCTTKSHMRRRGTHVPVHVLDLHVLTRGIIIKSGLWYKPFTKTVCLKSKLLTAILRLWVTSIVAILSVAGWMIFVSSYKKGRSVKFFHRLDPTCAANLKTKWFSEHRNRKRFLRRCENEFRMALPDVASRHLYRMCE
jgi:hypothetical protein